MATLGDLHDLSLSDEFTNSSTGTRTVDLQTIHNRVDSDKLHLRTMNHTSRSYLRHFSKQFVIVSLVEVNLVVYCFSHLSLAPLLTLSAHSRMKYLLTVTRLQTG